nr:GTP-binding protein [Nodosilinea sp. LEGE 07298]
MPNRDLPVTIIKGFLGSGKTILTNRQNLKIPVLVSDARIWGESSWGS